MTNKQSNNAIIFTKNDRPPFPNPCFTNPCFTNPRFTNPCFYKSVFYKSACYKSVFYKSVFYKSSFYKSMFYKSVFYKSVFYKSSPCFTNPIQSVFYNMPLVRAVITFYMTTEKRLFSHIAAAKSLTSQLRTETVIA